MKQIPEEKILKDSLIVVEFDLVSGGYRWLGENYLEGVQLLEAALMPMGKLVVLAKGDRTLLKRLSDTFDQEAWGTLHWVMVEAVSQNVLDAYYSLARTGLEESLLIVETPSLPQAISIAHRMEAWQLKLVDIRSQRQTGTKAIVFATGKSSVSQMALERLKKDFAQSEGEVSFYTTPTSSPWIQDLFS